MSRSRLLATRSSGRGGAGSAVHSLVRRGGRGGCRNDAPLSVDFDDALIALVASGDKCQLKSLVVCDNPGFSEEKKAAFEMSVDEEVAAMSKATFGEPLMHAIGHAYVSAAKKYIGYRESLMGIDGVAASMQQRMRNNWMQFDVVRKGISSLNRVQRMNEVAEEERQKRFSEPEPPSPEMLAAKQMAKMGESMGEECKQQ